MKNHPIVILLLLFQIISFGVFCKDVNIVYITNSLTWFLDANFKGQVYFGSGNLGGYQKWIRQTDKTGTQFINLATQQCLYVIKNNDNSYTAYTGKNNNNLNQYWTVNEDKKMIINNEFNVILSIHVAIPCTLLIAYNSVNVVRIRLQNSNLFLACYNKEVYQTTNIFNDYTIWIKIKDSDSTDFTLANSASNGYLTIGDDKSIFTTLKIQKYNERPYLWFYDNGILKNRINGFINVYISNVESEDVDTRYGSTNWVTEDFF